MTPEQMKQMQLMNSPGFRASVQARPASNTPPTAPQMQPAPQPMQQAPEQGLLARMGAGINNFRQDPEKMARLTMGLNSMRLNPDAGIAASAADTIKQGQTRRIMMSNANVTVQRLRDMGRDDLADMVEANPAIAKDIIAAIAAQGIKMGSPTETMRTRIQTAQSLGYPKDSPEYNAIIGGTTSTKQASDLGARIAGLRKEFTGNNATKDFQKIVSAFTKIQSAASNPSPASDMSLIFNYMKMLDPGSTVREGEYATAQNATNIPNRIRNAFNAAVDGTKLNHVQRADFATAAGRIYDGSFTEYKGLRDFYTEQATQVDPTVQNSMPSFEFKGERLPSLPNDFPETWTGTIMDWTELDEKVKDLYLGMTPEQREKWHKKANT